MNNSLKYLSLLLCLIILSSCGSTEESNNNETSNDMKTELSFSPPEHYPVSTITQDIGYTRFTVKYDRPNVSQFGGSSLFGKSIPMNQLWNMGGSIPPTITSSDKFSIDGQELAAGSYILSAEINDNVWKVHLYGNNEKTNGKAEESNKVLSLSKKIETSTNRVECLSFSFESVSYDNTQLVFAWDNVRIPFDLSINYEALVLNKINDFLSNLDNSKSEEDLIKSRFYYEQSANYLSKVSSNNDELFALSNNWLDKAVEKDNQIASIINGENGGAFKEAIASSLSIKPSDFDFSSKKATIYWLKANNLARLGQHSEALDVINQILVDNTFDDELFAASDESSDESADKDMVDKDHALYGYFTQLKSKLESLQ